MSNTIALIRAKQAADKSAADLARQKKIAKWEREQEAFREFASMWRDVEKMPSKFKEGVTVNDHAELKKADILDDDCAHITQLTFIYGARSFRFYTSEHDSGKMEYCFSEHCKITTLTPEEFRNKFIAELAKLIA